MRVEGTRPAAATDPEKKRIVVGISDLRVSRNPKAFIITHSLGPCIGLIAYDPGVPAAGLLHFQLPSSKGKENRVLEKPYMFADVAIPKLIKKMFQWGSDFNRLEMSVFGGAGMMDDNSVFKIGIQNTRAVKKILWQNSLRIKHEDVGGKSSRTISIELGSGIITQQKDGEISTFK